MTSSGVLADLAEREPSEAIVGLKALVARARLDDDADSEAAALIGLGRTRRALGHVDLAEHSLRAAIALAEPDGSLAADAHLVLASVLSISGHNDEAFAHLTVAAQSPDVDTAAAAEMQRAVLLQRTGHFAEALDIFDRALPDLRAGRLASDVARVLANRGEIHARLGNRDQALADYREAALLFGQLGQPLRQAQTLQNVGWVYGLWGDLPEALAAFDEVRDRLRESSHDVGAIDVSRAEALLIAGLDREALAVAGDAVRSLLHAGCDAEAARGLLLAAQAGRDVDRAAAAEHAARAADMFADQGAESWRLVAVLEMARSDRSTPLDRIQTLIDQLSQQNIPSGLVSAHALAAERSVDEGNLDAAQHHVDAATAALDDHSGLDLRLDVLVAAAQLAAARLDPSSVLAIVGPALDDIDRRVVGSGEGELRAAFRSKMQRLQTMAVRACIETGDVRAAVDFGERMRRTELRPVTRSVGSVAADRQRTLQAVASQVRDAEVDQADLRELHARREEIRLEISQVHSTDTLVESRLHSGHGVICLLDDGDRVRAVRRTCTGDVVVDLGERTAIREVAQSAASLLAAGALTGRDVGEALQRHVAVLDRHLGRILGVDSGADGTVALSGPSWMATIPWRLLPSLGGAPITFVPSTQWLTAPAQLQTDRRRVLAVAGPGLHHGDAEAVAIAAAYREATVLMGSDATAQAVLDSLPHVDVLHVVAHGRLDRGNPEWSSLELAGGSLTVNRLRADTATPPTVVLSACHSAPQSGDDLLGFAGALFASGTRNVIASSGPLPDTSRTVESMASIHRLLAAGRAPSVALAEAFRGRPHDAVTNGLLVGLGSG